jgi:hypothetical protein
MFRVPAGEAVGRCCLSLSISLGVQRDRSEVRPGGLSASVRADVPRPADLAACVGPLAPGA